MAVRPIIIAPDKRLKLACKPVEGVGKSVRTLMDDMLESMYASNGIGLAAPQLGVLARVIVLDVARADNEPQPLRLANPEIRWVSDELVEREEGCLSFPEHFAPVTRPERVRVAYLDHENRARELEAAGLLARCVQHEMDHLDGLLFVDYLSALKRNVILRKLAKTKKLAAEAAD